MFSLDIQGHVKYTTHKIPLMNQLSTIQFELLIISLKSM